MTLEKILSGKAKKIALAAGSITALGAAVYLGIEGVPGFIEGLIEGFGPVMIMNAFAAGVDTENASPMDWLKAIYQPAVLDSIRYNLGYFLGMALTASGETITLSALAYGVSASK